jgi:hypothetical protein
MFSIVISDPSQGGNAVHDLRGKRDCRDQLVTDGNEYGGQLDDWRRHEPTPVLGAVGPTTTVHE